MNWLAFAGLMGASFMLALISFGLGARYGFRRGAHMGIDIVLNSIHQEYRRRPPEEQQYIDELIKAASVHQAAAERSAG